MLIGILEYFTDVIDKWTKNNFIYLLLITLHVIRWTVLSVDYWKVLKNTYIPYSYLHRYLKKNNEIIQKKN